MYIYIYLNIKIKYSNRERYRTIAIICLSVGIRATLAFSGWAVSNPSITNYKNRIDHHPFRELQM